MKVTRNQRPDKIECRWGKWRVSLEENNEIYVSNESYSEYLFIKNTEDAKQFIKALQIILESK